MNYIDSLTNAKVRVTPHRLAILETIHTSPLPLDISQIHQLVSQNQDDCDLATVYRNIETLVKHKIIKQVDFREGKYRYEVSSQHHHHLVCTNCGKITPIYDKCLAISDEHISKEYNFKVSEHHLEFFGICNKRQ